MIISFPGQECGPHILKGNAMGSENVVSEIRKIDESERHSAIVRAHAFFDGGFSCSQSVLLAFADRFNLDEEIAKKISANFGGGMGRLREKCGALTGAFMVLGLKYGNSDPADMDTKLASYDKVRELNKKFDELYNTTQCGEIIEKYATEEEIAERKHRIIICRKIVGDVTGLLYDMLEADK